MPSPKPRTPASGRSGYCVGGRVPVAILLAHTDEVYAAVTGMVAFPDELRFTLTLGEHRNDQPQTGLVHRHELALWEFETDEAGQVGPDIAYLTIRDAAGNTVGLEDLDGFDGPPGNYRMPLPPPGPLDFTFVWPSAGIRPVTLGLHAEILHEAADRAVRLWEGGDTVSDLSYWTVGIGHTVMLRHTTDADTLDVVDDDHLDSYAVPDDVVPGILLTDTPVEPGVDAAARIDAIRAYPKGFAFTVHIASCYVDPHDENDERDVAMDFDPFPLDWESASVQFSDGRSGTAVRFGEERTGDVAVHTHQSSGGGDRFEATFWVAELPPSGPLTITYSFPGGGIDQALFVIDGAAIRLAARRARPIFPGDTV